MTIHARPEAYASTHPHIRWQELADAADRAAALELDRLADELALITGTDVDWLVSQSVDVEAIDDPDTILIARCKFYPRLPYFYFDNEGEQALIFIERDRSGQAIDLIAWDPTADRVAALHGNVAMLGRLALFRPRLDEQPTPIFRSPLDWLRANRRGAVVVDVKNAADDMDGLTVVTADASFAKELLRHTRRSSTLKILIEE